MYLADETFLWKTTPLLVLILSAEKTFPLQVGHADLSPSSAMIAVVSTTDLESASPSSFNSGDVGCNA